MLYNNIEVINMLDLLIKINRKKLERSITKEKDYDIILTRSQKLDKLINRKMGIKNHKKLSTFYLLSLK